MLRLLHVHSSDLHSRVVSNSLNHMISCRSHMLSVLVSVHVRVCVCVCVCVCVMQTG